MELPELPRPGHTLQYDNEDITAGDYFTADQMRVYGEQCALFERERCARLCEAQYELDESKQRRGNQSDDYSTGYHEATGDCAAAVRKAPTR